MSPNTSYPLVLSLFLLLIAASGDVSAQSSNTDPCGNGVAIPLTNETNDDPNRFVGVCGLENSTSSFTYDGSTDYAGELQFSVRSCSTWWGENCEKAIPYTVVISGESSAQGFILRRDRGNGNQTAAINIEYSSGNISHDIPPDTEVPYPSAGDGPVADMFPGGANGQQRPASMTLSLADPSVNLRSGVYSGTFYLSIYQCGSMGGNGWNSVCNGQNRYAYLENLPFHIELRRNSTIDISGVDDIQLSIVPGNGATGSMQFCVESGGGALFRLTADSAGGNGQFLLQGVDQLAYSATVEHTPSARSEILSEGQPSTSTWPGHASSQCLSQENMEITISVDQAALNEARDTHYVDTLTLTVELE